MRGVTDVFFQLTALTSDRVELGESDAVIQLSFTYSSMEGIVLWSTGWKDSLTRNQSVAVRSASLIPPRLRLDIRVLEPGRMPSTTQVIQLLSISEQHVPPTVVVRPLYAWGVGDQWGGLARQEIAQMQVHIVNMMIQAPAQIYFVLGSMVQDTPLSEFLPFNVSSRGSWVVVPNFAVIRVDPSWGPDQMMSFCSSGETGEDVKLCLYEGAFSVLGGTEVHAWGFDSMLLESEVVTTTVPIEVEPASRGVRLDVSVDGVPAQLENDQTFVLPSSAINLNVEMGSDAVVERRHFCLLTSRYSLLSLQTEQHVKDCSWMEYSSALRLDVRWLEVTLNLQGESLNVTVLWTTKYSGFLWTYPQRVTFLSLRERADSPRLVSIREAATLQLAAMIWSPRGNVKHCVFTVHSEEIHSSDLAENWLHEIRALSASNESSINTFFEDTDVLSAASSEWVDVKDSCSWRNGQLCTLLLDGHLPLQVIVPPAEQKWVCAWTILQGHMESSPSCLRIDEEISPNYRVSYTVRSENGPTPVPIILGRNDDLNTIFVVLSESGELMESSVGHHFGFDILESTHPMKVQISVVPAYPWQLQGTMESLRALLQGSNAMQTDWNDCDIGDNPEMYLFDSAVHPLSHALVGLSLKVLTDVNRWSLLTSPLTVLLRGRLIISAEMDDRAVHLRCSISNATWLYRWSLEEEDVRASGGGEVYRFASTLNVSSAFSLDAGVRQRLQPVPSFGSACTAPVDDDEARLDSTIGPRLCTGSGNLTIQPPSHSRWHLWAAAFVSGLALSDPVRVTVAALCASPNIEHTGSACLEGDLIFHGKACTTQCAPGFGPSSSVLMCNDGQFYPETFTCRELSCQAPTVQYAEAITCMEGSIIPAGGVCTPLCEAYHKPNQRHLTCNLGSWDPLSFVCEPISCSVPPNVLHAMYPACAEGLRVNHGQTCTPQCQEGYGSSEQSLICIGTQFSPETFSCQKLAFDDTEEDLFKTLIGGILGSLIVAGCLFGLWMSVRDTDSQEDIDRVSTWRKSLMEVDRGICVFCGRDPEFYKGTDATCGVDSEFLCCVRCAEVLVVDGRTFTEICTEPSCQTHQSRQSRQPTRSILRRACASVRSASHDVADTVDKPSADRSLGLFAGDSQTQERKNVNTHSRTSARSQHSDPKFQSGVIEEVDEVSGDGLHGVNGCSVAPVSIGQSSHIIDISNPCADVADARLSHYFATN